MDDSCADCEVSAESSNGNKIEQWSLENIDIASKTVTLLNLVNPEEWKEDFSLELSQIQIVQNLIESEIGESVIINILEGSNTIVKIHSIL